MTIVVAADDQERDIVAPCWPCCKVTFETLPVALSTPFAVSCCFTLETSTMQKHRVFEAFQTKTSQVTLKINKNQRRKAW